MSKVADYFKRHKVQQNIAVVVLAMPYLLIALSGLLFEYLFETTNRILAKMDVVLMAFTYDEASEEEYYESFSDER